MSAVTLLRVNVALLSSARGSPPKVFLSRLMVEILSVMMIFPFSSTLDSPVVEAAPATALPSATVKSKLEIVVKPFGATYSTNVYEPFLRPSNVTLFPENI